MRIACVLIPSFAVAVERLREPRLAERPVVVYDRAAVLDASDDAAGVHPGAPLRQFGVWPNVTDARHLSTSA